MKGAPERVVDMCRAEIHQGREAALDPESVRNEADRMGEKGLRVLAMAVGHGEGTAEAALRGEPSDLVFAGL
nr:hypothetical protein [Actinomycetota bacterium]NIU76629.1 hypothetical protein [Gammaproteobacteria bacterium]